MPPVEEAAADEDTGADVQPERRTDARSPSQLPASEVREPDDERHDGRPAAAARDEVRRGSSQPTTTPIAAMKGKRKRRRSSKPDASTSSSSERPSYREAVERQRRRVSSREPAEPDARATPTKHGPRDRPRRRRRCPAASQLAAALRARARSRRERRATSSDQPANAARRRSAHREIAERAERRDRAP